MPFLDKATEDFVLGQRSGFGKDMDKEYKNSSVKKRQRDLIRFLTAQGEEETKNNKIMDDRFEKSINSPAYASAQNLNNFAGSGREVKYNLVGRGRVMADPNPNNPFRDIYEFARANPQAFETMVQGTVAQSPTKILGYGAEQFTGDSTTGNRISESVLDELTQQRDGKPGGRFGFRPEMTDEEKRVAANDFYEQQRIDNEGRDMAKGMLLEGGFTTDATYGDALDTASWLIPGPGMAVKGLGVGVKASRLALAAAKTAGSVGKKTKLALGGAFGAGVYANQEDDAKALPIDDILKLGLNSKKAATKINQSWNARVRGDYRKASSNPLASLREALAMGQGQSATERTSRVGWNSINKPIEEGAYSIIPNNAVKAVEDFVKAHPNKTSGDINWGHLFPRSKGGSTTGKNVVPMDAETNAAMGDLPIDVFVKNEMSKGLSLPEVKNRWSFNHIPDNVLLGAKA